MISTSSDVNIVFIDFEQLLSKPQQIGRNFPVKNKSNRITFFSTFNALCHFIQNTLIGGIVNFHFGISSKFYCISLIFVVVELGKNAWQTKTDYIFQKHNAIFFALFG